MDIELAIVAIARPRHILLGVVWIGFIAMMAWVLHPAADKAGEKGLAMLRTLYTHSILGQVLSIASIGTTVLGLLLWGIRADGMDLVAFGNTGDIVMAVGALAGVLAFGHSISAVGRYGRLFAQASQAYDAQAISENLQSLNQMKAKLFTNTNISAWISLVSVVCMSSARYPP
ncbi:MAG UNVERIFIED_CONTAM: hypothetical protein LVT10_24855 [Anaerolineae bacterium]|jgi:hypothetical protein